MKCVSFLTTLGLATGAFGLGSQVAKREGVQVAHLTFNGGPASYTLDVPADGSIVQTNNDLSISIIDTPGYDAFAFCKFYTDGEQTLIRGINQQGVQQILVGPPQPIRSVSCQGSCIYTYGDCYRNGQYLGPCCDGFCAANKCRPWIQPS